MMSCPGDPRIELPKSAETAFKEYQREKHSPDADNDKLTALWDEYLAAVKRESKPK